MSSKTIILLFCLGLSQPLMAANIYKGCFSNAIYDDDGRPDDSFGEKIIKLQHKKMQAIKIPVLDPIDHEIEHLEWVVAQKWVFGLFTVGLGYFLYPPSYVLSFLFVGGRTHHETVHLKHKVSALRKSRRELVENLEDGELNNLEYEYIKERPRINQNFRDRIEYLLIDSYKCGADHKILIEDLLFFPTRIKCLSKNGDEEEFVNNLCRAQDSLALYTESELFAATNILMGLAEASYNALKKQAHPRCAIYCETGNYDRTHSLFKNLADILDRSFFVVFAKKDSLSHELIFGVYEKQRGIILESFLAQKNNLILNPLLIIIGIDEWITNDNLSLLLPLLDPDPPNKMVQSNYLGLAIDWSAMSVLSCGSKPSGDFPGAIKSRLQCYKID